MGAKNSTSLSPLVASSASYTNWSAGSLNELPSQSINRPGHGLWRPSPRARFLLLFPLQRRLLRWRSFPATRPKFPRWFDRDWRRIPAGRNHLLQQLPVVCLVKCQRKKRYLWADQLRCEHALCLILASLTSEHVQWLPVGCWTPKI